MKRIKTSLLSSLRIKPIRIYDTDNMKDELIFPDVAERLERVFQRFNLPQGKVIIFGTNKLFLIAYCNGKIRVSDVQLSPIGRSIHHKWVDAFSKNARINIPDEPKMGCLEPFGPNRDTLEYMLYHYKHLSVIDAVNKTKSDEIGAHLAP